MRPRSYGAAVNYGLRRPGNQVNATAGRRRRQSGVEWRPNGAGGERRSSWPSLSVGVPQQIYVVPSPRLVDVFFGPTSFHTIHAPFAFVRRKREDEEKNSGVHLPIT